MLSWVSNGNSCTTFWSVAGPAGKFQTSWLHWCRESFLFYDSTADCDCSGVYVVLWWRKSWAMTRRASFFYSQNQGPVLVTVHMANSFQTFYLTPFCQLYLQTNIYFFYSKKVLNKIVYIYILDFSTPKTFMTTSFIMFSFLIWIHGIFVRQNRRTRTLLCLYTLTKRASF